MKDMKKVLALLLLLLLPSFLFAVDDAFIMPFQTMLITWMTGQVGLTVSIIIMVISVLWGAAGGGFAVIGKGFLLSIIVGGIIYFATWAFNIGTAFTN